MSDIRPKAAAELVRTGIETLSVEDPGLFELLENEIRRQRDVLAMVAASSIAPPSVLACEGLATTNVTAEGYPGARLHAGCELVDRIECLAIDRARAAFGARYANVQPHSGSSANAVVMFGLLAPGDTILGMELRAGGHLTHGAPASISGQCFRAIGYGLGEDGLLDYDEVRRLALRHRPRLIVSGGSSYPRTIDFARFREIADEVGAWLLADISHIAGLIAGGVHPSPIDLAHFTTTSTYKQLYGPRGGLILSGRDHDAPGPQGRGTLAETIQNAVFPFFQGTPNLSGVAAKARALARVATPEFRQLARRIVEDARALAGALAERGFALLSGGTDNHLVLLDIVASRKLTGRIAERALEECNIIVNRSRIPRDGAAGDGASGLRLGTNSVAVRGLGAGEMSRCAELVGRVLDAVRPLDDRRYELADGEREATRGAVRELCRAFPIPDYPADPD